ncbi:hypothetical protein EfmJHP35_09100 [Enterococcus faecium]|nr:hypothetical protein EfmJHP35_09100 [Enterococcus faecium]
MKYILCQPAINRFKWELEVCLTNLKKLGIKDIGNYYYNYKTNNHNNYNTSVGDQSSCVR